MLVLEFLPAVNDLPPEYTRLYGSGEPCRAQYTGPDENNYYPGTVGFDRIGLGFQVCNWQ